MPLKTWLSSLVNTDPISKTYGDAPFLGWQTTGKLSVRAVITYASSDPAVASVGQHGVMSDAGIRPATYHAADTTSPSDDRYPTGPSTATVTLEKSRQVPLKQASSWSNSDRSQQDYGDAPFLLQTAGQTESTGVINLRSSDPAVASVRQTAGLETFA
jgi:hypothetical protein